MGPHVSARSDFSLCTSLTDCASCHTKGARPSCGLAFAPPGTRSLGKVSRTYPKRGLHGQARGTPLRAFSETLLLTGSTGSPATSPSRRFWAGHKVV
jgi:hypothetical protein